MTRCFVVCGLAALGLMLASSSASLACGGAFMQAFFFQKNPQAKSVSKAVRNARDSGVLEGDRWDKSKGMSLHAWRAQKVESTLGALQERLNVTVQPSARAGGSHVFLINEFAWLDILAVGNQVIVTRTSVGPDKDSPRIFTTRQVLDNVLAGNITFQQAVEDGLIASACATQCTEEPYRMLGYALSKQQNHQRADGS